MKALSYLLLGTLAYILGWCTNSQYAKKEKKDYDTIQRPPVVITNVKVDTLYIIRPLPYLSWKDQSDTIYVSDRCWQMREFKEYRDSNFYAKISGLQPRLDEIKVYPQTVYETRYVYRDIHHNKPKRWGIGLSAGYGLGKYGFTPTIALAINYNIICW